MSEAGKVLVFCKYCGVSHMLSPWQIQNLAKKKFGAEYVCYKCRGKWLSEKMIGKAHFRYKEKIQFICSCGCGEKGEQHESHYQSSKTGRHFIDKKHYGKWLSENRKGEKSLLFKGGREKSHERRKNQLSYKLGQRISASMRMAIKRKRIGIYKNGCRWELLLGYNLKSLIRRLQKTMPEGYSWQDFLNGKLHIDHIIPVSVFHFESVNDLAFKECWALKNLRLLPAEDNMRKHTKLLNNFQPVLNLELLEGV